MKKILLAALVIVCFASPSWAVTNHYGATCLIGGNTGCLDSINGGGLVDGDMGTVFTSAYVYYYSLNANSGQAESSPDIISPDVNAGDKRWIKLVGWEVFTNATVNGTFGTFEHITTTTMNATQTNSTIFIGSDATFDTITGTLQNQVEELSISAGAMTPDNATSPTANSTNLGDVPVDLYMFGSSSSEYLSWQWADSDWNAGTLDTVVYWSVFSDGFAGDMVEWGIACRGFGVGASTNGTLDNWFNGTTTITGDYEEHKTIINSITVDGSPSAGDRVVCRITRAIGGGIDNASTALALEHANQYYGLEGTRTTP